MVDEGVVEKLVEAADGTGCVGRNKRKIVKGAFEQRWWWLSNKERRARSCVKSKVEGSRRTRTQG